MASATLNLRVSPRRMLTAREAAEYCGLPAKRFITECSVTPIEMSSGAVRWDMHDLDGWIDNLKTGQPNADDDIVGRLEG